MGEFVLDCVVITRGGSGDIWKLPSLVAAGEHPIAQFGDAYLCSAEDVADNFTLEEIAALAARLNDTFLEAQAKQKQIRSEQTFLYERAWGLLRKMAQPVPEDANEVVRIIRADRQSLTKKATAYRPDPPVFGGRAKPNKERPMAKKTAAPVEDDPPTPEKAPRARKFSKDSVITLGVDANGNSYGKDNNPKRSGSAAGSRFELYENGLTIEDTIAKGVLLRDINYDVGRGFISLG
jgi:hypothetical protein